MMIDVRNQEIKSINNTKDVVKPSENKLHQLYKQSHAIRIFTKINDSTVSTHTHKTGDAPIAARDQCTHVRAQTRADAHAQSLGKSCHRFHLRPSPSHSVPWSPSDPDAKQRLPPTGRFRDAAAARRQRVPTNREIAGGKYHTNSKTKNGQSINLMHLFSVRMNVKTTTHFLTARSIRSTKLK